MSSSYETQWQENKMLERMLAPQFILVSTSLGPFFDNGNTVGTLGPKFDGKYGAGLT